MLSMVDYRLKTDFDQSLKLCHQKYATRAQFYGGTIYWTPDCMLSLKLH